MGCSANKEGRPNIEQMYRNKNLPIPEGTDYENNFEKEAFMTINLLRNDPKAFINDVRAAKSKHKKIIHQCIF